jgi:hypothetical protein
VLANDDERMDFVEKLRQRIVDEGPPLPFRFAGRNMKKS